MTRMFRGASSAVLLGILLMPSPRLLFNHKRTHRRHALCEHHLRHHHQNPQDRERVIRVARHRIRREEARAREQERLRLEVLALYAAELTTTQAAADPLDDADSRMKKPRRRGSRTDRFWNVQDPPRIRPPGEFLAQIRIHLDRQSAVSARSVAPQPHFGSGPCHSIPRPREGTTVPPAPSGGAPA